MVDRPRLVYIGLPVSIRRYLLPFFINESEVIPPLERTFTYPSGVATTPNLTLTLISSPLCSKDVNIEVALATRFLALNFSVFVFILR